LHVTVSPDNASDKSVSWSSSDHNVIDVDDKGMVTARNAGKAFVIVKSKANDILKDSCEVIVLQPVTGVIISEPTITFGSIGSTKQLSATVLPNNASDKSVRWESSNVSICMVSDNGLVVAVGTGTAVVSVTTIDGGYIAVCVVTVTESDGIMTMEVDDLTGNEQIYDIQGKCIQSLQKGINIIRMNDGTIKKVIVK
ncbi:MAG: Ig domain-containing protein, partial [Prevotella sp.]|nr:Ig domain-containing protein [Prevotella sp.]